MRKFFTLVLIFSTLISVLSTCTKDKTYHSDGYIKGTITGKNKDTFKYNDSFNYTKFYDETDAHYIVGDGYKQFYIYRIDPDVSGIGILSFTLMDSGTIVDANLSLTYVQASTAYYSTYSVEVQNVSFSSVNFDETTHLLTGNYSVSVTQYNASNVAYASKIEGSFRASMKKQSN